MDQYTQMQRQYRRKMIMAIFALATSVISLSFATYAWFIFNRNVSTHQDKVIVSDEFAHKFSFQVDGQTPSDGLLNFTNMYPGVVHKRNMSFHLSNISDNDYYADIYLKTLDQSQEVPDYDASGEWDTTPYYYYLGSQIQVSKVTLTIDGQTPSFTSGQGSYLLTTSSQGVTKGQVNGVSSEVTAPARLNLLSQVLIPQNKTLVGAIDFTFVDNGTNQNMFMKDFAGTCIRYLEGYLYPVE